MLNGILTVLELSYLTYLIGASPGYFQAAEDADGFWVECSESRGNHAR